mmetsp:Transcript_15382/g.63882  ORF Transcript_15382/g.63882 Transcript_15382/m.63882 type:complete len:246 (-) Transcript_15382:1858-2595(-)
MTPNFSGIQHSNSNSHLLPPRGNRPARPLDSDFRRPRRFSSSNSQGSFRRRPARATRRCGARPDGRRAPRWHSDRMVSWLWLVPVQEPSRTVALDLSTCIPSGHSSKTAVWIPTASSWSMRRRSAQRAGEVATISLPPWARSWRHTASSRTRRHSGASWGHMRGARVTWGWQGSAAGQVAPPSSLRCSMWNQRRRRALSSRRRRMAPRAHTQKRRQQPMSKPSSQSVTLLVPTALAWLPAARCRH